MANEVVSRHVGSAGEILLLIPLKPGFAPVSELVVSYATRLRSLLETLSELRVRKFQRGFGEGSGPVERLQTLHRVQWTVMESQQVPPGARQLPGAQLLVSAHFDSSWEDYLHRLRDETGKLLDLIFSHCAGYEGNTCQDDYENFRKWIRDHQRPCNFLYAASPEQTSDDVRFLKAWMALSRAPQPETKRDERSAASNPTNALLGPEDYARVRAPELVGDQRPETRLERDRSAYRTLHGLAELRDRLFSSSTEIGTRTGYDLFDQAIKTVLEHEQDVQDHLAPRSTTKSSDPAPRAPIDAISGRVVDPIGWARELLAMAPHPPARTPERPVNPNVELVENVQGNLLQGYNGQSYGCVLLVTCRDARAWETLLRLMETHLTTAEHQRNQPQPDALRVNFALTFAGLQRLGLAQEVLEQFPTEFRQGMESRSALLGDSHAHDPYYWEHPVRNGFQQATDERIKLSAIDAMISLTANSPFVAPWHELRTELEGMGLLCDGIQIVHVQPMGKLLRGHFGLADGVSQPIPDITPSLAETERDIARDRVPLGELVLGYDNNRGFKATCAEQATNPRSYGLFKFGSFLAVRKIMQDPKLFEDYAYDAAAVSPHQGDSSSNSTTSDAIGRRPKNVLDALAEIVGRQVDGNPLPTLRTDEVKSKSRNAFDYSNDRDGRVCPLHAHIRLANPRWDPSDNRGIPVPRILRRGMSYGPDSGASKPESSESGLLFMAYNASLADQYEVIQRWLNGSNITGLHSSQNDLLTAPIREAEGPHYVLRKQPDGTEGSYHTLPRRGPAFTQLRWGLYLFAPARSGISWLLQEVADAQALKPTAPNCVPMQVRDSAEIAWKRVLLELPASPTKDATPSKPWAVPRAYLPSIERGRARIAELDSLPADLGRLAWKKLIEESVLPDSLQAHETEDVWAAIRADRIGIKLTPLGVLVSNEIGARCVLGDDGSTFSVREYERRITTTSGDHYLAHDVTEPAPPKPTRPTYGELSERPNELLYELKDNAFELAHEFTTAFLRQPSSLQREPGDDESRTRTGVGIRDLARVVIARLCEVWFDMPLLPDLKRDEPASYARSLDPYLVCSRHAFQHTPEPRVEQDALGGGRLIQKHFLEQLAENPPSAGYLQSQLAIDLFKDSEYLRDWGHEKNRRIRETLIGSIVGFAPPTYGSVNRVLDQFVETEQFWSIQQRVMHELAASVTREVGQQNGPEREQSVRKLADNSALRALLAQAMGGTPSPLTLYRTTKRAIELDGQFVAPGTKLIVGMASVVADARSLGYSEPEVWFFGGAHGVPSAGQPGSPHGCPAREAGLRVILGVLVALCERNNVRRERRGVLSFDRA